VIQIWEEVQGHELSQQRLQEFRRRPEIAELIDFGDAELRKCAVLTKKANGGRLLLADWLALAEERLAIADQRRRAQSVRAESSTRTSASLAASCQACGRTLSACKC
jgi:hypothetical protein